MTEKPSALDQKLHDMDESNKIYEFAETVLGCNDKQADIMSRTMRHKFTWSGVRLLWNGDAGEEKTVAVDHVDRIKEYLVRENYDFLLPKPGATVEGFETAAIPGDVLDAALNGSQTAKGKICLLLGGDNQDAAARTELLLKTERAKRDGANGADDANRHGQTQAERRTTSTNPFVGLRDKSGKIVPEKMKKVESFIKAAGAKAAAAVAKSAGLRLDGTPIPEQYR
jgi:hypothetical protein